MLKHLLCASLLGLTTLGASAADLTPTLGEESAYEVTKVTQANENTILTYEIDKATNTLIPAYYEINVKGEWGAVGEEGTIPLYFKWQDMEGESGSWNGTKFKFNALVPGTEAEHSLTYYIPKNYGEVNAVDKEGVYFKWQITDNKLSLAAGSESDYDIVYWKDSSISYDAIEGGTAGADINHGFVSSPFASRLIVNTEGSSIGNINGDFVNAEILQHKTDEYGDTEEISTIKDINGNFINSAITTQDNCIIENISGNFIANTGNAISIYDEGEIGDISGNFIANSKGIFAVRESKIGNVNANFIGNELGITMQYSSIESVTGNFIGNYNSWSDGAAIHLDKECEIGYIRGNFIGNNASAYGGAISSLTSTIGDITADFIANYAAKQGGAIDNNTGGKINIITGNFILNSVDNIGGAIGNLGTIKEINGNFVNNDAASAAGAIANGREITTINADFIANISGFAGGAIYNTQNGKIENFTGDFIGNSSVAKGGALYNLGTFTNGIVNSSFVGNYLKSDSGDLQGGAIFTNKDLRIVADNHQNVFSGNYTESGGVRDDNAIYVDGAALTFELKNGGEVVMKDNIDGVNDYAVNITGDNKDTTTFYMHNDIRNSILSAGNTTLNMINDEAHVYDVKSFTLTNDINLVADVDLANEEMDRITADTYGTHSGTLHVVGMNILSDAPSDRDVTEIYFAETGLMNNVTNGTGELPDQYQTAYTPIYKYNVDYETREDDGGYFLFSKGGLNSGNPSDSFNPAVLNTPVANLAAGQATINETFKYVFEHADAFTQLPATERMAQIKNNYYALSTDYNTNLDVLNGGLAPEFHNNGAWVRPYVTFETMNLKNGPDVDAITYGTLIGFDSDFEDLGNGWTGVTTGYVGYNGSQLSYSGNDTSMNGGLLGLTQTFYKGNFWTALTASAGASVGETSTMYGSEDFTSLLAGVGSKTGYNFEFQEGKFILQPIMFLSYTFVNTFDYTNAAGVKIESDPLHTLQLNPSVRFIANLKNGWQPYASVGMVWNLLNQTDTTANGISLPDMHVKPYVEYGIGVQKRWADKFTAFFQTMIRNGGRNGVALTGGFRWSIGKDPDTTVNNVNKVKKVIKSRTSRVAGK